MQELVFTTVLLIIAAGILGFFLGYLISGMFDADQIDDRDDDQQAPGPISRPAGAPAKQSAGAEAQAAPAAQAAAAPARKAPAQKSPAPAPVKAAPVAPTAPAAPAGKAAPAAPIASIAPAKKPAQTPLRGPVAVRAKAASKKLKPKSKAPDRAGRAPSSTGAGTAAPKLAKSAKPAKPAKPRLLKQARRGKPDDLKRISGVGPKLEGVLNKLGFYHYDQVASLTSQQIDWVDEKLSFKGRIEREGWVGQAAKLAAGEQTEFSRRADKSKKARAKNTKTTKTKVTSDKATSGKAWRGKSPAKSKK